MSYGSVPHYNSVTPEERERWKTYLAQKFQKPKEEVVKKDWLRANSFKYTSMIHTALDAGLRPCEVGNAKTRWVDTSNGVLRIPREESNKNRENWTVALKPETVSILKQGSKGTPDRTNQLVRSGRTLREYLMQYPFGGELGDIDDPSAPLWVKTEQQECAKCGKIPQRHEAGHEYEPDLRDRMNYNSYYRRFKAACDKAGIPENKTRPYNLRHTRLTEVATFMGYEQLNKFADWKPGSDRAKVYVHLNNDDVNKAIRDEYGISNGDDEDQFWSCGFCSTENRDGHTECRNCGRPQNLEQKSQREDKQEVLEHLKELEEKGVLEKLDSLEE